jgi:RNA polymerase sigma-70 factor (ECF subfamily)
MAERTEEFIRLFAASQRRIYGLVAAMVPRGADADDVFQEVSASLWQKFDDFTPGTDFAAWGLRFARLLVLKHYEKQRRWGRVVFDDDVLEQIADETTTALAKLDHRQEALRDCLARLPAHSRQLLDARYDSGLKTCQEVAHRVGRSVQSVYKALSRIHELLLECIEKALATGRNA